MANSCKYKKLRKWVSYNNGATWQPLDEYMEGDLIESQSTDCGACPTIYQWRIVYNDYLCEGTTKYQKLQKFVSDDCGVTYMVVTPEEYKRGSVIEYHSEDCNIFNNKYLTFVVETSGNIKWSGSTTANTLSYSTDEGDTWNTADRATAIAVSSGDRVLWKGTPTPQSTKGIGKFSGNTTARYSVEGNAMSLLFGDDFSGQTSLEGKNFALYGLFSGNTNVTSAENMSLPATTLAEKCYRGMFQGCASLTTAPELPSLNLANNCYGYMFFGCVSLTTAPKLLATTLADSCYSSMFEGCSSLTTAPQLPATTLADSCYSSMFEGCASLTTAPELPSLNLADNCYRSMFEGCRSLTTAPQLLALNLTDWCYADMFYGCTSLTTAPQLPALNLATNCYDSMFCNCRSLTTAPQLPATTLSKYCYRYMFSGCRNIRTSPQLNAVTLTEGCYFHMFFGCTILSSITCLATDISALNCTYDWTNYVSSSGTFTKAASMTSWTEGSNGIPSGWSVQDA